jgi:hypothetical protein
MPFKEELPLQCPPEDAVEDAIAVAYRMVYANPPTEDDFKSKKALGHLFTGDDECGFASCSLNANLMKAQRLAALPKPREKGAMVAKVSIPAGWGMWKQNSKKHIHYWMYDVFDHTKVVLEVMAA